MAASPTAAKVTATFLNVGGMERLALSHRGGGIGMGSQVPCSSLRSPLGRHPSLENYTPQSECQHRQLIYVVLPAYIPNEL